MEIITKRFLLRDFVQEDEFAFLAYHADPRYAEFCSPEEVLPDFTHQLFQRLMQWATEVPRCNYQLAIDDRRNLQLIGCAGLRQDGYAVGQAELGSLPENHGSIGSKKGSQGRLRLRHRLLLLGTLILAVLQLRVTAAQPTFEMKIDRFIAHQMATQYIPGLALAITYENQVMYVKGYGKENAQQSVTTQMQFPIASLSKYLYSDRSGAIDGSWTN